MKKLNKEKLFANYPETAQARLEELRELIHSVAKKTSGVGDIEECFKWGELSFVTSETNSGSTIRIDWKKKNPDKFHLFFNCQTKLASIFKEIYPNDFQYTGNRRISFGLEERIPKRKLSKCIEIALTYNLNNYKNFFN